MNQHSGTLGENEFWRIIFYRNPARRFLRLGDGQSCLHPVQGRGGGSSGLREHGQKTVLKRAGFVRLGRKIDSCYPNTVKMDDSGLSVHFGNRRNIDCAEDRFLSLRRQNRYRSNRCQMIAVPVLQLRLVYGVLRSDNIHCQRPLVRRYIRCWRLIIRRLSDGRQPKSRQNQADRQNTYP